MSAIDDPMAIITAEAAEIETFVMEYLFDNGVAAHIVEAIAKKLPGTNGVEIVGNLMASIVGFAPQGRTPMFDLELVINEAAAFEFLVRYARKVSDTIIPIEIIPSALVVEAMLLLFHESKKPKAAAGHPDYHGCGG